MGYIIQLYLIFMNYFGLLKILVWNFWIWSDFNNFLPLLCILTAHLLRLTRSFLSKLYLSLILVWILIYFSIFWHTFRLFNLHVVNFSSLINLLRYNLWLFICKYGLGWDKSLPWPACFTAIIGIHLPYQPKTYDRTWLRSVRWITCFHDVAIILL